MIIHLVDEPDHLREEDADRLTYIRSDIGNAERFRDDVAGTAIYVPSLGWFTWTGTHWRADDTEQIVQLASQSMRAQMQQAIGNLRDPHRTEAIRFALKSETSPRIRGMLELARSDPKIVVTSDKLDAHSMLLNVANGTIDLTTGTLRGHRREDYLTHFVNVPYDPDAAAPRFQRFLREILRAELDGRFDQTETDSLIAFVQRLAGYLLTGSTQEQVVIIFYGSGSNGKDVLLTILRATVGDLARVLEVRELLFNKFDSRSPASTSDHIARLRDARIVTAEEVDAGRRFDEAHLKNLTGGAPITARSPYKTGFEYVPQFKFVITCNHLPHVHGTDHGIWRRLKCIPFNVQIADDKQDKTLAQTIIATEMPGVLAWAVEGCKEWRSKGLGTCNAVEIETTEYRQTEDVVGSFLADRCVLNPSIWTPIAMLHTEYVRWAADTGHNPPMSSNALSDRLRDRPGLSYKRKHEGRGWQGVGMLFETKMAEKNTGRDA